MAKVKKAPKRKPAKKQPAARKAPALKKPRPAKKPAKQKQAPKVRYSDELVAEMLAEMAGGRSMNAICTDPKYPTRATVYRWLMDEEKELFKAAYNTALLQRAEAYADEVVDISDGKLPVEIKDGDGNPIVQTANDRHARDRTRADNRKWAATIMNPKKYGPKADVTLGDPNGNALQFSIGFVKPGEDPSE